MKITLALIVLLGVWASANATYRSRCKVERIVNGITKKNGKTLSKSVQYIYQNDKLTYECNHGYKLVNGQTRVCNYNKLSGNLPKCIKIEPTCSWPGAPSNGKVVRSDKGHRANVNDYVTFSCSNGYRLHGAYRSKCLSSGKFSPLDQKCIRVTCTVPAAPANGAISGVNGDVDSGDNVGVGRVIRFSCKHGYKLIGSYQSTCQNSGVFSPLGQRCERTCKVPNGPANGKVTGGKPGDRFDVGDSIGFECNSGYELFGSDSAKCGPNGNFSPLNQRCRKPCAKPRVKYGPASSAPTFKPNQASYPDGTKLTVTCPKKYTFGGYGRPSGSVTQHTCNNGVWVKPVRRTCGSGGYGGYIPHEDSDDYTLEDFFGGDYPHGY